MNLSNITDNKKFWKTVNPLFSNRSGRDDIVLISQDKIISNDADVAQTFNDHFKNCVSYLNIKENKFLLCDLTNNHGSVNDAINKFQKHPSIKSINENVDFDLRFSFSDVNIEDIRLVIKSLKNGRLVHF